MLHTFQMLCGYELQLRWKLQMVFDIAQRERNQSPECLWNWTHVHFFVVWMSCHQNYKLALWQHCVIDTSRFRHGFPPVGDLNLQS